MRNMILAAMFWVVAATGAGATGGFDCVIDDPALKLSVAGTTGRGMGGPIIAYETSAEVLLKGTPPGLAKPDLSKGMVHHWLDHPELWLHFYGETSGKEPFSSVELVIKTTAVEGDDIAYAGDYLLKIYQAEPPPGTADENGLIEARGRVTCGGE